MENSTNDIALDKKQLSSASLISLFFAFVVFVLGLITIFPNIDSYYSITIMMIIAAVIIFVFSRKSLPEKWPLHNEKITLGKFLVPLGLFSIYHLILNVIPSDGANTITLYEEGSFIPYVVFMGIATPICEDLVFRGIVLEKFRKFGPVFSIICSSILFGMYHLNPIQLVSAFFLGLIMGYVAIRYSVIWSILLHFINNCLYATVLPKLFRNSSNIFINKYMLIIVLAVMSLIGITAMIKEKPFKSIKSYLSQYECYDKSCWKKVFLNKWFIIYFLIFAGASILMMTVLLPLL